MRLSHAHARARPAQARCRRRRGQPDGRRQAAARAGGCLRGRASQQRRRRAPDRGPRARPRRGARHRPRGRRRSEQAGLCGHAREPQTDGPHDSFGPDLANAGRLIGRWGEALTRDRGDELPDEERVTARRREAGRAELGIGLRREPLAHEHADRRFAQRRRAHHERGRIGHHFCEQAILGLGRANTGDDEHREPLEAPDEIGKPAKRGPVRPLKIVDRE